MVLGVSPKGRRRLTVQLEYLIHVQEIKPWPPSQSLKSVRSVLIRWENGERNAGSTKAAVPDLGSGVSDGKIEFNESFRIPVTLVRDMTVRGGDGDAYQKNYLEFNFYEPRREKTLKGQLIGTAIIDLAAYGLVKESVSVSVPVNSKRSFSNTAQPLLVVKIQSAEKGHRSSSSRDNLLREASMDRSVGESVSALMNEEYAEEAETASMTSDDVSSHSSLAVSYSAFESNGGLSPHREENRLQAIKYSPKETYDQQLLTSKEGSVKFGPVSVKVEHERRKDGDVTQSGAETNFSNLQGPARNESNDSSARVATPNREAQLSSAASVNQKDSVNCPNSNTETTCKDASSDVTLDGPADDGEGAEHDNNGSDTRSAQEGQHPTNRIASKFTQSDTEMSVSSGSDGLSSSEENSASNSYIQNGDKLKNVKSVRSSVESFRSNGSVKGGNYADFRNGSQNFISNERKDIQIYGKETRSMASESRIQQLESKLKMLEGELREAAAIEVGLYSVVAEHGSSITKLHAPARRLSRLYLHACKEGSQSRRGHAARSAVSGLVLVAKACGNDVPRLTFWLSNSIVLRAIISTASTKQQSSPSTAPVVKPGNHIKPSSLKWKEFSPSKDIGTSLSENPADWNDPDAFTSALEKIEAWIFSRIIESVWWQTLTPHMQSAAAKSVNISAGKTYRASGSDDQEQVIFSLELWKNAFKDACERLCPVRAAGHDCGCLPMLAKLIMEQCVARLDVAMFNAILRETGDEIPTDPVSDPVSDAKVLPIQAGKASFGAGAQLKTAIGNWSRWLTNLFGIDDGALLENEDRHSENDDEMRRDDTSSKCFRLLNALSNLMMLPKDMLLSESIRKEVCPTFAAPMIRRVLDNFVPDEFCPDTIPEVVLEALDSEDPGEAEEGTITNFPCTAAPVVYLPPPVASVAGIISNTSSLAVLRRSGSSVLKKSYTSDDELEEFESPLAAIINSIQASPSSTKPSWIQNENGQRHAVRYQLLREVWMNSE